MVRTLVLWWDGTSLLYRPEITNERSQGQIKQYTNGIVRINLMLEARSTCPDGVLLFKWRLTATIIRLSNLFQKRLGVL